LQAPRLNVAIVWSILLVLLDGLLFDQGLFSLAFGAALILGRLPYVLLSRHSALRRPRLRNIAVYLLAVGAVLAVTNLNNRIAQTRADALVVAVNSYHAKHARYPESLDRLVPEFIDRIRPAKLTLGDSRFRYITGEGGAMLYYTVLPPYGRRVYDFPSRTWTFRD
jgi:hypothetical protein